MSDMIVFKQDNVVAKPREMSEFAKSMVSSSVNRRLQFNINGTIKRIVNGEVVGTPLRGEVNVVIVNALPKVSRIFYAEKYDPNKEATLPNCWSNLGDRPEPAAPNPQHTNCADCPQNIKGSGENGGRACRYQRRIAVLLEGDPSGEVYQVNIPAKSLFGKGVGNVHPFESYIRYLIANNVSPDSVVTNISFDSNADAMELLFTPVRPLSDKEYDLVKEVQTKPETKQVVAITVAQADKVTAMPKIVEAAKPKVVRSEEPDEAEEIAEPVKRPSKKASEEPVVAKKTPLADVINAWSEEE